MWRNIAVLFALISLVLVYGWYDEVRNHPMGLESAGKAESPNEIKEAVKEAPDFTVEDIDGRTVSLSSFKGKSIVLNFWASWCAPCVIEFPQMLALAKNHPDDVFFLFLSQDDSDEEMMRFVAKLGNAVKRPNVFIARDKDKSIAQNLYATYKLPETYLLSPAHNIEEKIIGLEMPWDSQAMREKIAALAARR